MFQRIAAGVLVVTVSLWTGRAAAEPLAEKYLLQGKLTDGEKALKEHLAKETNDDQARFGLGVVQFLRAFERCGATLYKHGLRTERAFAAPLGLFGFGETGELLPQNPKPETLTYEGSREIVKAWVTDLNQAEATLAEVKDDKVKLPLHVGLIKIDLFGQGKPVNAAELLRRFDDDEAGKLMENFVITFDRGDVCWLRGYCHFLAAWGELMLAVDNKDLFERTAHLFFEKVESPHAFLQEEGRDLAEVQNFSPAVIADLLAFIHQLRLPVKEPARCKSALGHLEAMLGQAKEMWKHYQAEADNENEWIPNAKQESILGVKVTKEIMDTWLATLDEAEQVLQGKKLIPFWRGKQGDRGLNLRRAFTEPRSFDPILWFQGTAATPYLEKGELTKFADERMLQRMNDAFGGGLGFAGFALWFN
jgi:hypothetical protein